MRIYLIGYMGCGKTTVGKRLAKKLNFRFIDLDQMIEEIHKKTIAQIFNDLGQEAFREIEKNTLAKTFNLENTIIATGGGAPCFFDNMQQMNTNGKTVYIKLTVKTLCDRLSTAQEKRPLIAGKSKVELQQFVQDNLILREPFYNKSQVVIDGVGITPKKIIQQLAL